MNNNDINLNLLELFKRIKFNFDANNKNYEKLLEEIGNTSLNCIIPLNSNQTFILRKKVGVFDYGFPQDSTKISVEMGMDKEVVRKTILDSIEMLKSRIEHIQINAISPLDNDINVDIYKSKTLIESGIEDNLSILLAHKDIYTIYELSLYSKENLLNKGISEKDIEELRFNLCRLNINLYDSLNLDRNVNLRNKKNKKFTNLTKLKKVKSLKINADNLFKYDIKKLLLYIENNINADYLNKVGIEILKLNKKSINKLHKMKVFNLNDLICLSMKQLDDEYIINKVHDFGLRFIDE